MKDLKGVVSVLLNLETERISWYLNYELQMTLSLTKIEEKYVIQAIAFERDVGGTFTPC